MVFNVWKEKVTAKLKSVYYKHLCSDVFCLCSPWRFLAYCSELPQPSISDEILSIHHFLLRDAFPNVEIKNYKFLPPNYSGFTMNITNKVLSQCEEIIQSFN